MTNIRYIKRKATYRVYLIFHIPFVIVGMTKVISILLHLIRKG